MFPANIKKFISQTPPSLQVAVTKNWSTNSTGGDPASGQTSSKEEPATKEKPSYPLH